MSEEPEGPEGPAAGTEVHEERAERRAAGGAQRTPGTARKETASDEQAPTTAQLASPAEQFEGGSTPAAECDPQQDTDTESTAAGHGTPDDGDDASAEPSTAALVHGADAHDGERSTRSTLGKRRKLPKLSAASPEQHHDASAQDPAAEQQTPLGAPLQVEGLGLVGPRGPVFTEVELDVAPGVLVAVEGPAGSGRSSLLLTLTGRMKPTAGHAECAGLPLPKRMAAVRRLSAVAAMPGVTDLDPALSVAEHLRERVLLQRRFVSRPRALLLPRRHRAADVRAQAHAAVEAVGLDLDALPKGSRTRVRDLERLAELRLSVALALVSRPRLLAVDDVELGLPPADREVAWELLRSLARAGTTVLAACTEAPADVTVVRPRGDSGDGTASGDSSDEERREPVNVAATETEGEESGDAFAEAGRA